MYKSIAVIGGGKITHSILSGLSRVGYPREKVTVSSRGEERLRLLTDEFGIHAARTNREAVQAADIMIIAVKPNVVQTVCQETADIVSAKKPLIISLATATPIALIHSWFNCQDLAIVRTMTNILITIGKGITALFANSFTSNEQKDLATSLFAKLGNVLWVENEAKLNTLSPLIGAGPAHLYLLMEALQKAAIYCGISEDIAKKSVVDVIFGAAELAKQSNTSVSELREKVTTPNGVTEASLKPLLAGNYFNLFQEVLREGEKRCSEIEKSLIQPLSPPTSISFSKL